MLVSFISFRGPLLTLLEALQLAAFWHLAYLFLTAMLQFGLIPFHKDANTASVLGTVSDRDAFEDVYYI